MDPQRPTGPRGDVDGQWLHDKAPTGPRAARQNIGLGVSPATTPNSKLVVSNLHYEITPKDLTVRTTLFLLLFSPLTNNTISFRPFLDK